MLTVPARLTLISGTGCPNLREPLKDSGNFRQEVNINFEDIEMLSIQLNRSHLRAALITAGVSDSRKYLNGVHVEASMTETRATATTGGTMGSFRHIVQNDTKNAVVTVTIPREVIALLKSAKGLDPTITKNDAGDWFFYYESGALSFKPLDGQYPDYRRVLLDQKGSGEAAFYHFDQLAVFAKIAKTLGKDVGNAYVLPNGNQTAAVLIKNYNDFIGGVQPIRIHTDKFPETPFPAWGKTLLT